MAFTSGATVIVGSATLKSDYDLLGASDDWLQTTSDVEHNFDVSTGTGLHKAVSATGVISTSDATEATDTTTASLKTAGGIAWVKDCYVGDDMFFTSGAVLDFGAANAKITHSAGAFGFGAANLLTTGTLGAGATTVTDLTSTGNTTIGNATGDALTFHPSAWTLTNAVSITGTWTDLGTVTTADINGGTLDAVTIGATTPAAATVTTLNTSDDVQIGAANGTFKLNVNTDVTVEGSVQFEGFGVSAAGPEMYFNKTRGATAGSHTIVADDDELGQISFYGSDGSAFREGARLTAEVDGTPGASDMPGRFSIWTTADGAASPTRRVTVLQDGNVGIGTASPYSKMHLWEASSGASGRGAVLLTLESDANENQIEFINAATSGAAGIFWSDQNANDQGFLYYDHSNDDMLIGVNGGTAMRLDSSGNLGLGVTPQATWHGDVSAYQIGGNATMWANTSAGAGTAFSIAQNAFYNSSNNPTYISNDEASYYNQVNGTHAFYTAGASTGTITWGTAKLTIANSGLLTTTTAAADVGLYMYNTHASTPYGIQINFSGASPNNTSQYYIYCLDSTDADFIVYSDGAVQGRANSYGGISDVALKTNIVPARDYWDDWKKLKYSKWQWTNEYEKDGDEAKKLFGIVAQDLAEVFPGCTYDTDEGLAVRTSVVNTIGGRVLQRAQERIEDVEGAVMKSVLDWKAEAKALRAELNALKKQMAA